MTMNGERVRRLERLYFIMKEVAAGDASRFNLRSWFMDANIGKFRSVKAFEESHANCGTIACAFGWAALDPELRAEGLGYRAHSALSGVEPFYEKSSGYDAAVEFFHLSHEEVMRLFCPQMYPIYARQGEEGALEVAKRVLEKLRFYSGAFRLRNPVIDEGGAMK